MEPTTLGGRKDRKRDGRTESQKLCPFAFLRKGRGQKRLFPVDGVRSVEY